MEFMIRDRLSWMRFLGFDLGGPMPDENTIRLYRDKLNEAGTLRRVKKAFDWQLRKKGYIPSRGRSSTRAWCRRQSGAEPKVGRRRSRRANRRMKSGPTSPTRRPRRTRTRWTLKVGGKPRYRPDGTPLPMIAVPVCG
ncbi:MAG: transposase [Amaricoccus sp.]